MGSESADQESPDCRRGADLRRLARHNFILRLKCPRKPPELPDLFQPQPYSAAAGGSVRRN